MSLVHLRLQCNYDSSEEVVYCVESADFTDDKKWHPIGELIFNKPDDKYHFSPTVLWSDTCGYPKEFATPENQILSDSLGQSPWAKVIVGYAEQFKKKKEFPKLYPPIFDKSKKSE